MALCPDKGVVIISNNIKRASLTVEAAYIVPVILMIVMVLLYAIIMEYDRGLVYIELRKYSEELCAGISSAEDETAFDVKKLQKRMLIYHIDYIDLECKSKKVIIKGKLTGKIGPKKLRHLVIGLKQSRNNTCRDIRRIAINNE